MKLILKYGRGYYGTYEKVVKPIIYESKKHFLADFEAAWLKCSPVDYYDSVKFEVGKYQFWQDEHRNLRCIAEQETYDVTCCMSNYETTIKLPEVYTVDEWFKNA